MRLPAAEAWTYGGTLPEAFVASSSRTRIAVGAAAAAVERFEDKAVEAALVCLDSLRGSVVDHLLQHDPQAVLPLLTTGAGAGSRAPGSVAGCGVHAHTSLEFDAFPSRSRGYRTVRRRM